jgi:hypothetical protein
MLVWVGYRVYVRYSLDSQPHGREVCTSVFFNSHRRINIGSMLKEFSNFLMNT